MGDDVRVGWNICARFVGVFVSVNGMVSWAMWCIYGVNVGMFGVFARGRLCVGWGFRWPRGEGEP